MTVLQQDTTGGVSSNRWGKYVIGLAAVVVGLAAAYGISQQIDNSGSVTIPVTQGSDFRTNVMQKRALEGYAGATAVTQSGDFYFNRAQEQALGAATTLSPASKVADIQRHLEAKRALEGVAGASAPTVGSDMNARVEAGRMLLEQLNEAAILQARIRAGLEQARAIQAANEAWPTGSPSNEFEQLRSQGVVPQKTTTPQQLSGPR